MLLFLSCESTPVIGGEKPFIVMRIERVDDKMVVYTGPLLSRLNNGNFDESPKIVLPKNLYNIGDTIKVQDFKPAIKQP